MNTQPEIRQHVTAPPQALVEYYGFGDVETSLWAVGKMMGTEGLTPHETARLILDEVAEQGHGVDVDVDEMGEYLEAKIALNVDEFLEAATGVHRQELAHELQYAFNTETFSDDGNRDLRIGILVQKLREGAGPHVMHQRIDEVIEAVRQYLKADV